MERRSENRFPLVRHCHIEAEVEGFIPENYSCYTKNLSSRGALISNLDAAFTGMKVNVLVDLGEQLGHTCFMKANGSVIRNDPDGAAILFDWSRLVPVKNQNQNSNMINALLQNF